MSDKERVLSARYFVNDNNQIEGIELIEDSENPDGVLTVVDTSSRFPGIRGRQKRLPDKHFPVRLQPTGNIIRQEPTLYEIEFIMLYWTDYGPLVTKEE